MIAALIKAFENDIANCLIETDGILIEVYDGYDGVPAEKRCYVKREENEPVHFTLNNPDRANLIFMAIDNCLLKSTDQSTCDFAIGNFKKLYFVEIKQVKTNQRSKAKEKAFQQLGSSISIFREKIALNDTELIAVICLKVQHVHPMRSAAMAQKMVAFKEKFNASLMEGQSHTF